MPYLVNCRDCSYMAARETTYDLGNGSLVKDQHENSTFDAETGEHHECAFQTFFPKKSEFHSSKFEGSMHQDNDPNALLRRSSELVAIVRDEYAHGDIRVYPQKRVPEYVEGSNRYSIIHPENPDEVGYVDYSKEENQIPEKVKLG